MPSASSTIWHFACCISAATISVTASERPSPQPISSASARSASASNAGSASRENIPSAPHGMGRTTGSFSLTASTGHAFSGAASVTTPLPMRTAPCAAKYAAPV